jgi:molybdate transport system substrate-binding protein
VPRTQYLASTLFLLLLVLGACRGAFAQTEIAIDIPFPSNAAIQKVLPGFQAKTGYKVKSHQGSGLGTKQDVTRGEPYDVFVIQPPVGEALASGNLMKNTQTVIGSLVVAIIVKNGTPPPDISSASAVKKSLLSAKSVVTTGPANDSVGLAVDGYLKKLGILDDIRPKTKFVANAAAVRNAILAGSEIGIGPYVSDMSMAPHPDITVVGGLPPKAFPPTDIYVFVSIHAKNPAAAKALVRYLKSPEAEKIYKENDLLPRK